MNHSRKVPNVKSDNFVSGILREGNQLVSSNDNILLSFGSSPNSPGRTEQKSNEVDFSHNFTRLFRQRASSVGAAAVPMSSNNAVIFPTITDRGRDDQDVTKGHKRGFSGNSSLDIIAPYNSGLDGDDCSHLDGQSRGSRLGNAKQIFNRNDEDEVAQHAMQKAQPMFRYSLIFINFSFIVASLLLLMAGVVARENSAVKLCTHCGDVTMVPIVFGAILWLFSLFGFNWIRRRNILFLLVYVAFLIILMVTLTVVLITAGAYDSQASEKSTSPDDAFLKTWIKQANSTDPTTGFSPLCQLQAQFNCSGFVYGCCTPEVCYNETSPPHWVSEVCPICPKIPYPASKRCTKVFYSTLTRNLGGFLVICSFSFLLILCGMLLSALSRKLNYLLLDESSGVPDPSPST